MEVRGLTEWPQLSRAHGVTRSQFSQFVDCGTVVGTVTAMTFFTHTCIAAHVFARRSRVVQAVCRGSALLNADLADTGRRQA